MPITSTLYSMDSAPFGPTSQATFQPDSNGFNLPAHAQSTAPFSFSPTTSQQLSLGSPPAGLQAFAQPSFGGPLGDGNFAWPPGVTFDETTAFLFDQAMSNQQVDVGSQQQLPSLLPPPQPYQPTAHVQTSQRFHPYGAPNGARTRGSLQQQQAPTSLSQSPAGSITSPLPVSTPPTRPSPAHSTPKLPVTYPEASTPLTILPSPAPTKDDPPPPSSPPAPPRPRPTTRIRRTNSLSVFPTTQRDEPSKLDALFHFLDQQEWTVDEMLVALSQTPKDEDGSDLRSREHVERMEAFLKREGKVGGREDPKGPDEVAKMWKESLGEGAGSEKELVSLDEVRNRRSMSTNLSARL